MFKNSIIVTIYLHSLFQITSPTSSQSLGIKSQITLHILTTCLVPYFSVYEKMAQKQRSLAYCSGKLM
jgi:hypothetical protein